MNESLVISDFIDFLNHSPTAWHAVRAMTNKLAKEKFLILDERAHWNIQPGCRYSVTRNGSTLCAFTTPHKIPKRLRLFASHTDSPGFKLKPQYEIKRNKAILFGVEIYGAPLITSWLNRDLGIAGRILYYNQRGEIQERLVRLDKYGVTIPQLAIHLDREVNDKGPLLNKQEHLNVLAGLEEQTKQESTLLERWLSQEIDLHQLISHDLFLFPLEKAALLGNEHQLIAAYRIDSLASVHAALTAFLKNPSPLDDEIKMVIFWDHEEIGSQTSQGADSPFFTQVIERLMDAYRGTKEDYFCMLNRSICVSIDLAHGLHPNYPEKHDLQHQPILGQGVVLKNSAQQRYATQGVSSLPILHAAKLKQIPLQHFVSRNDIPSGSTIGPLHASRTGIPTVDIGSGQLSIHSCRELMACQDHISMCRLLEELMTTTVYDRCVGAGL